MKLMLVPMLAVALGVAAPAFAHADEPSAPAQAAEAAEVAPLKEADRSDPIAERHCLRHTGTHFTQSRARAGKARCAIGPGRAYTREDLDRTGAIDLADALRRLDPAIR